MIDYKGFIVKNTLDEITISEFEIISGIMQNEELVNVEKYMEILELLGIPEDNVNQMTDDEFFDMISKFQLSSNIEMKDVVTIDGYEYRSFTDEFVLSVKDLSLIEKAINEDEFKHIAKIMAIIFKRTDLTKAEHYDKAHLKHKETLFKNLTANIAYPYILHIAQKLSKKLSYAQAS